MTALPRETGSSKNSPIIFVLDTPNYADNLFAALEVFDIPHLDIKTGIRFANAGFAARQSWIYDFARLKPKSSGDRAVFRSQKNAHLNDGNIGRCFSDIYIHKENLNWEANNEARSRHIANNNFWPVRRYELSAGKVDGLLCEASLLDCSVPQRPCETPNSDGGKSGDRNAIVVKGIKDLNKQEREKAIGGAIFVFGCLIIFAYFALEI